MRSCTGVMFIVRLEKLDHAAMNIARAIEFEIKKCNCAPMVGRAFRSFQHTADGLAALASPRLASPRLGTETSLLLSVCRAEEHPLS